VCNAGRQESKGCHFFLVQDVGLGLLQFASPLGDARFELRLVLAQGRIETGQVLADVFEQQGQRVACPGDPAQHDQGQHQGQRPALLFRKRYIEQGIAGAVERIGPQCNSGGMADGAANERQQIVIAERALQAAVVIAQQADEQRFHERNGERITTEEHAAAEAVVRVEQGVDRPQGQDSIENRLVAAAAVVHIDENVAHEEAKPADFYGNRFGGQFPA